MATTNVIQFVGIIVLGLQRRWRGMLRLCRYRYRSGRMVCRRLRSRTRLGGMERLGVDLLLRCLLYWS